MRNSFLEDELICHLQHHDELNKTERVFVLVNRVC